MKTIIVIRAVSGSGKSFFAETLKSLSPERVVVCCADNYFIINGEYKFDASKLCEAHLLCQKIFVWAVNDPEVELIVVANTNSKKSDWSFYEDYGKQKNIPVIFAVIENRHGGINQHGVGQETLDRQANNIKMSLCL